MHYGISIPKRNGFIDHDHGTYNTDQQFQGSCTIWYVSTSLELVVDRLKLAE